MNENSLKNLEKRKSFSKDSVDVALECQAKSVAKRKENRDNADDTVILRHQDSRQNQCYQEGYQLCRHPLRENPKHSVKGAFL